VTIPPLPSIIIALGLLLVSIVVSNRLRKQSYIGKRTARVLLVCAVPLLAVGFALHFSGPAPGKPSGAARPASSGTGASTGRSAPDGVAQRAPVGWSFSFEPKSVRWGQQVEIRVAPPKEDVTVYYNGRPLPARSKGSGTFIVTVPTMSKDGRFSLECGGVRVEAAERLVVSAY
jgi:hypothetical protein